MTGVWQTYFAFGQIWLKAPTDWRAQLPKYFMGYNHRNVNNPTLT